MANNAAQLGGPGGPEDLDPNVQAPALELVETANESADTTTAVADGVRVEVAEGIAGEMPTLTAADAQAMHDTLVEREINMAPVEEGSLALASELDDLAADLAA